MKPIPSVTPSSATPAQIGTPYSVAVRTLCEFTAKQGDLDLRFTPSPSAREGIAGHKEVTSRRGPQYQREVSLSSRFRQLLVRGRADGYDPNLNRVEEIKTHQGDLEKIPENHRRLHWAQAKVYAWLMCQRLGLCDIDVAVVYFNITSQQETVVCERHDARSLLLFFESQCLLFLHWADQERVHRQTRDTALVTLPFPHGEFRTGQRALSVAVYKANLAGRCLMAQAPTGIGKTIGTLFPVLKACPGQLDKVFYLTAKTPGRQLALNAMQRIQVGAPINSIRVLELVARDKACEHPDRDCHGESCPLAKGFYDRLPQARQEAIALASMHKLALRELALKHGVCPYYLGQEMVRWSDVVVGDFNHYFDLHALLYSLTDRESWRVSVLVDEAHNLVDRARQMYTARLSQQDLLKIRQTAPPALKKPLDRVRRCWNAVVKDQCDAYKVHESLPAKLFAAFQELSTEMNEAFNNNASGRDREWQRLYFDLLHFQHIAKLHGPHSLFDISLAKPHSLPRRGPDHIVLCLRNVVPAPLLQDRWTAAHAVTLFSATLRPAQQLQEMLGLPENTAWVDLPSPFNPRQLQVHVAHHISTRYANRQYSLDSVVALMAGQFEKQRGNYLAFFSSFDYLQMAVDRMALSHPQTPIWLQSRQMDEAARDSFLARFTPGSQGIGFAVLGGAFGEGVDLPGTRLIGAFIATLGMPQVNPVNEQMRKCIQTYLGDGYNHTYLYPGLQKVVQAAGRVIRTPEDHGVLHLMDDRFAGADVQRLLPAWWARPEGE